MQNHLSLKLGPGFEGFGPLGLEGGGDPYSTFNKVLSSTVGIMTIIAFIWFIFLLLSAAYEIMNAGGDSKALESGKKKITTAIQGLIFVIAAVFLINLIGFLLGVPNILNPGEFIQNLGGSQ